MLRSRLARLRHLRTGAFTHRVQPSARPRSENSTALVVHAALGTCCRPAPDARPRKHEHSPDQHFALSSRRQPRPTPPNLLRRSMVQPTQRRVGGLHSGGTRKRQGTHGGWGRSRERRWRVHRLYLAGEDKYGGAGLKNASVAQALTSGRRGVAGAGGLGRPRAGGQAC